MTTAAKSESSSGRGGKGAARPTRPVYRLEIGLKPGSLDPAGLEARTNLAEAGLAGIREVQVFKTFFLRGRLGPDDVERAAREVLADPVQEVFAVRQDLELPSGPGGPMRMVTVLRKSGVTNPEAESARIALTGIGIDVRDVQSARTYLVWTKAREKDVLAAARRALGNDVIEDVVPGRVRSFTFPKPTKRRIRRRTVPIRRLEGKALVTLSFQMGLSLTKVEMEAIRDEYRDIGREPTDVELETLAQTWSEHCKHKTLAGAVEMSDERGERRFENLLKETVFHATTELDKSWCWSVFEDNAGVIDFDGEDGVCMKVETHNHPSAIEPYGGAGTGIGGVIRDILGTGKGARPVANTDVFCFGPPDMPMEDVPKGSMHPRRILRGVVAGVRDYGNRMGIPTVNGALMFDERYVGNPVVYCGCVGIIPRKDVSKKARPGDLVVAFGGKTGRDGIHGATFSSVELHSESETVSSGAVQIGDPITEKKVLDILIQARDKRLFTAVTDCGAGGFSSAVGEMGEHVGANVDVSKAPLKYEGLDAFEIWISEAQERMVAAIPPKKWPVFKELCDAEDVEAFVLGEFTGDKRLTVRHGKTVVCDLDMGFLHDGLPRITREATFTAGGDAEPTWKPRKRYDKDLLELLGMPQIGSKEWVIRQYDHEVQAGAVVRPLTGTEQGPADAAVVAPKLGSNRGIVLSNGINPAYGDIDPYAMAMAAVDEAMRNAVAVGADPARIAVLDNFTWGNCNRPSTLGTIVRACEGCRDAALLFGTPFISGKDSLNNEFRTDEGELISVPPTLLISAIGVIADVRKTCTSDLKTPGNPIYVVGLTHDELGGSHWYRRKRRVGRNAPQVREDAPAVMKAVAQTIRKRYVRAAHDPSEGGIAVAAAEMAFASDHGMHLDLRRVKGTTRENHRLLFSESTTRFLLEVDKAKAKTFEAGLKKAGVAFGKAGRVTKEPTLTIVGRDPAGGRAAHELIRIPTVKLRETWRNALHLGEEA
ncbi:MAG: phosphoribosylformylglycinamidine synthase subunit PurL [Planctomycetota bacterium]|nr:phosphoribosylformylglycinamidine synthase subunit PurL [Planctomycetota bacterium]